MKVVFGKLKDRGYPQDITEAEADMRFQRLLIQGIGTVVARILSPTDVILKLFDPIGRIRYVHRRRGYFASFCGPPFSPWERLKLDRWQTLARPTPDARQLISDFDAGVHKRGFAGDVIGVPFKYHAA